MVHFSTNSYVANSVRFALRFGVIQKVLTGFNKIGDFMKWARFVVFLLAILVCVNLPAQGPGGGGNCTNLGCINLPGMHGFAGGVDDGHWRWATAESLVVPEDGGNGRGLDGPRAAG